ncbi:MAG: ABC transporter permease, partial [Proteobacteria bacterium]|nr:ABC transporter permease [Pseudomonadota bacterium]
MLAYIIRRLSQSTLVMAIVALLAFTVVTFVGDPVQQMVGLETSREDMEKLRESLGL